MERIGRARLRALAMTIVWALLAFGAGVPTEAAGPGVATFSVGDDHACAVRTDATVWCWGSGLYGQLGDGTTGDPVDHIRSSPVRVRFGSVALRGATEVAAGAFHSCAVRTGGRVVCWGSNEFGQLGSGAGSAEFRTTAVRVRRGDGYLSGVTALTAGYRHTCALRSDGGVLCWGDGAHGQLGDGDSGAGHLRTKPVRVREGDGYLGDVVAIAAGNFHTCALRRDGSVWCWGSSEWGQLGTGGSGSAHYSATATPVRLGGGLMTRASALTSGALHTCVRRTDGSAWCWGNGESGQLGDGDSGQGHVRSRPVQVRRGSGVLKHVTGVGAGFDQSCARRTDGSAWCWGQDGSGQLGDGTQGDPATHLRRYPVQVVRPSDPFRGVRTMEGGIGYTCALRTDRTVWCWGSNAHGTLGRELGHPYMSPYPLKVVFP